MHIALIYHDVVPAGEFDASGFPGPCAARYKFSTDEFHDHLTALQRVAREAVLSARHSIPISAREKGPPLPCLLTFDDGGASALLTIAGLLEERGWTGHFFITTDFIDSPAFLTREQVALLRQRGHSIGSHSCSHPRRMSDCTWQQLVKEWRVSCEVLSAIIGEQVTAASVPGGFYSRRVAQAAAHAGILTLFTSEPTVRRRIVDGCTVLGRYSIDRGVSALQAAAIASGRSVPRLRQALIWQAKKIAKTIAAPWYQAVRERLLSHSYSENSPRHESSKSTGASP